jgi:hypothetical protein
MATGWECADPRRPSFAAGCGGAQIRASHTVIGHSGRHSAATLGARRFRLVPPPLGGTVARHFRWWPSAAVPSWASSRARSICFWSPAKPGAQKSWAGPMRWPTAIRRPFRIRLQSWCWKMPGSANFTCLVFGGCAGTPRRSLAAVELARACPPPRYRGLQPRGLGSAALGLRRPQAVEQPVLTRPGPAKKSPAGLGLTPAGGLGVMSRAAGKRARRQGAPHGGRPALLIARPDRLANNCLTNRNTRSARSRRMETYGPLAGRRSFLNCLSRDIVGDRICWRSFLSA